MQRYRTKLVSFESVTRVDNSVCCFMTGMDNSACSFSCYMLCLDYTFCVWLHLFANDIHAYPIPECCTGSVYKPVIFGALYALSFLLLLKI